MLLMHLFVPHLDIPPYLRRERSSCGVRGVLLMICGTGGLTKLWVSAPYVCCLFPIIVTFIADRTKDRPLASGTVTSTQAVTFLGLQLTAGLGVLLQLNWYRY